MDRRGFLKLLGGTAAVAATPKILLAEPEPLVRRYWQVPSNAPIGVPVVAKVGGASYVEAIDLTAGGRISDFGKARRGELVASPEEIEETYRRLRPADWEREFLVLSPGRRFGKTQEMAEGIARRTGLSVAAVREALETEWAAYHDDWYDEADESFAGNAYDDTDRAVGYGRVNVERGS